MSQAEQTIRRRNFLKTSTVVGGMGKNHIAACAATENMKVAHDPAADSYVRRQYRTGWAP
jgi:hypothetical protein